MHKMTKLCGGTGYQSIPMPDAKPSLSGVTNQLIAESEILRDKIDKQSAEIKQLEMCLESKNTVIRYLLDQLPKPAETPEKAGKRIAQETLNEIRKSLEAKS
jgi:hypothetical protein